MRVLSACVAALMLAACAALPDPPDAALPDTGVAVERFVASGRIALRQGERSDHLRFEWRHMPDRDVVRFSSPLGQALAELGRDAGGTWLAVPGQPERRERDLRALAHALFGAPLPLDVLAGWLAGAGTAAEGETDGWRITVTGSAPYRQRRLPQRVEVRRDDVELRIVIDERTDDE